MALDTTDILADLQAEYLALAQVDTSNPKPTYTRTTPLGSETVQWNEYFAYRSRRMAEILDVMQRLEAVEIVMQGV